MIYDAIVIGTGGVGSAALYHLAGRGARVLGIDRYAPGHHRGSSHGQTHIIRQAYSEHADYVPLLKRAFELWSELEEGRSEPLYHETGILQVGPADGAVLPGVLASAAEHDLAVESLTAAEAADRFPGFVVPDALSAVFEEQAGYLWSRIACGHKSSWPAATGRSCASAARSSAGSHPATGWS